MLFCLGGSVIECTDFHSITVKDLEGNVVPMSVFKGKVCFFSLVRDFIHCVA